MTVVHDAHHPAAAPRHTRRMSDDGGRLLAFPRAPDAVELRHLRAFVAVAGELNFGRAAAQLYVSQPALSRQIRALERLVGCELLRRSTHRVELTLAGEALLDRARRLLADVDEAVAATQAVGGELTERAARLWAPIAEVWGPHGDLPAARAAYEELLARVPRRRRACACARSTPTAARAWSSPPRARPPSAGCYLHGGGHALGSAFGYQALAGALADAAGTGVLVPEYRFAPEHPFPAGLDDARARLPVAHRAHAAGAGHDLGRLVGRRAGHVPADAAQAGGVAAARRRRPVLPVGRPHARHAGAPPRAASRSTRSCWPRRAAAADAYLAGHPVDDPVVSPLTADLAGLPPLLIQAATGDHHVEDAQALHDHAAARRGRRRLELYPVDTHVFHIFWAFLPEAADAIAQAGAFVRETAAVLDDRERLRG